MVQSALQKGQSGLREDVVVPISTSVANLSVQQLHALFEQLGPSVSNILLCLVDKDGQLTFSRVYHGIQAPLDRKGILL